MWFIEDDSVGDNYFSGTIIVSRKGGKPMAACGLGSALSSLAALPVLWNGKDGWEPAYTIENLGSSAAAVRVTFANCSESHVTDNLSVAVHEQIPLPTYVLPPGFSGWAWISCDQPVAMCATEQDSTGRS